MLDGYTPGATAVGDLGRLEREEQQLSLLRRRLHDQIDNGYPNQFTLLREREVSMKRRALHQQIDALRGAEGVTERPDFFSVIGPDWEEIEPGIFTKRPALS